VSFRKFVPLTTRAATSDDAGRIAALHADSWRRRYRGIYDDAYLDSKVAADLQLVWRERLAAASPRQLVLVAERSADLAGFICVYAEKEPGWGSLIDNLHVAHEHQRSGTGTTLMREAAVWLGEHHADVGVYLWVLEANTGARRFYETLGARDEGAVEKDLRGGGSAPSCRYVWDRPAALLEACRRTGS
jgi:ribosomal protein S18 acetylase RimI-like enzyme